MKRRTKWILGLGIGTPVVLLAALIVVLMLSSSDPEQNLASIEIKTLPGVQAQDPEILEAPPVVGESNDEPAAAESEAPQSLDSPSQPIVPAPSIGDFGLPLSGTLVMVGSDKPFGEESFEITLEDNEVILRSNGRFWFKALIATITLKYDQILQMDSWLRPISLASSFDAPLGFGQDIQASFEENSAIVRSGKDVDEFPVDLNRAYILGTFSTYAIVPLLYELRESEGTISLETLVFGGPPNRDEESPADGLPESTITKMDDTMIQFGDQQLGVSQYEISGDMGTMTLFALDAEMLGLFAGGSEESLFVYRADYFEDGFEVVSTSNL